MSQGKTFYIGLGCGVVAGGFLVYHTMKAQVADLKMACFEETSKRILTESIHDAYMTGLDDGFTASNEHVADALEEFAKAVGYADESDLDDEIEEAREIIEEEARGECSAQ